MLRATAIERAESRARRSGQVVLKKALPFLALAALYGCSSEHPLPENPKEVEIEVSSGGISLPRHSTTTSIVFRSPESRFSETTWINKFEIPFRMSREELLSLYHFFRKNGFAELSTERGVESPEGGSVSYITLRVDGKTYNRYHHYLVKDGKSYIGANSTPMHVYRKNLQKCVSFARRKVNHMKVKCEIVIDESLHKKYGKGLLFYHRGTIDFTKKEKENKDSVSLDLFPGKQTFRLNRQDIKVHVRPETERITLFLENGKIGSR